MKIKINTKRFIRQADLLTPVSAYLRLRDLFDYSVLLESNDAQNNKHNQSILALGSIASFKVEEGIKVFNCGDTIIKNELKSQQGELQNFVKEVHGNFEFNDAFKESPATAFFGYTSFNAAYLFDHIKNCGSENFKSDTLLSYHLFEAVLIYHHHNHTLEININAFEGNNNFQIVLNKIENALLSQDILDEHFETEGDESSNLSDSEFESMCIEAKRQCRLGNVFQVVISRSFSQNFSGDEFHLYRKLRVINPSPFLFYFDFGSHKIFGSSPEAQIIIENNSAEIHPIAGTYKRSGNDSKDLELIEKLKKDEKENAEHIMLVDLARNDLSKHCKNVEVTSLKEIQIYSHVIHLVSKVRGQLKGNSNAYDIFADTFPAGTLSGAPKNEALSIIHKLEPQKRGFYGGAIGFFNLPGKMVHAIVIRSFESKNSKLTYQAGAGIVNASDETNEINEIYNKTAALKKALNEFNLNKISYEENIAIG